MRNEQIVICEREQERKCQADQIVLPDIRFQGLFVTRDEQEVLSSAYRNATKVLALILNRRKTCHQEEFEIDIPDLWLIAVRVDETVRINGNGVRLLRSDLRAEITDFMVTFQALVRHFLADVKGVNYSFDGKTVHGIKYKGSAWVSQ